MTAARALAIAYAQLADYDSPTLREIDAQLVAGWLEWARQDSNWQTHQRTLALLHSPAIVKASRTQTR